MTSQNETNQHDHFCIFRCQMEVLAIFANHVRSVSPQPEVTPIPFSDSCLVGMAYVHKEFIPVFDLEPLMNANESQTQADKNLLLVSLDDCDFGLLVDQVLGLESLEISYNGSTKENNDWTSVLSGSATYRDQFVSVINSLSLAQLLNDHMQGEWRTTEQLVFNESES